MMNLKSLLSGVFIGTMVGLTLGVLLAPSEGKVSRAKIAKQSKDILKSTNQYLRISNRRAQRLKKSVSSHIDILVEKAQSGDMAAQIQLENIARNVKSNTDIS